jgi:hypothetical protein
VDGVALSEKSGMVTLSPTDVVWVREPLTPVMMGVELPTGVLVLVVTVNVDDPVAGFGVKVPVAPVGNPLTLNVTAPVKLLNGLMVTL